MSAAKNKSMMSYLHWAIGVAIMLSGYVIPASEPLTPMGVKVLMVFVGMIYLWCMADSIGGSLLALFMISVVGYAPFTTVLSTAISDANWLTVFFACILMMSAIESGMPKYVSNAIFKATQGIVTGRPMVLVFILMCAAFIVAVLTNIIPTILMFWAICYAIIDDLKLEKADRYSMVLVFGTFAGAMLGNALLPFKNASLIIVAAFESASGLTLPYGPYVIINLICSMLIMVIFCLAAKYLFRIDLSKVKDIDGRLLARETLPPMSISVKTHLIVIAAFIFLVLLSSMLPSNLSIAAFLTSLGTQGIAAVLIIVLIIVRDNGKPCIEMGKTMKAMPWPAIFMVMAAVYLAGAMKNKDVTGIIPWLKTVLNPILGGHSEFVFAALIFVLAMVLTCFFHNGALGNMMMPVLVAIAGANSYNAVAIAAILTMTINIAFLAPSASNWAPLLHGNKEYMSMKDIWTYGLFFEILAFAIFMFLGFPLAKLMM